MPTKHLRMAPLLLMVSLLVFSYGLTGCSSDKGGVADPPATPLDYDEIQEQILNTSCVLTCHDSFVHLGGLDLTEGISYDALIGVPAVFDTQVVLVVPSQPDSSGLVMSLRGEHGAPQMPPVSMDPLSDADIQAIVDWIARGAPRVESIAP